MALIYSDKIPGELLQGGGGGRYGIALCPSPLPPDTGTYFVHYTNTETVWNYQTYGKSSFSKSNVLENVLGNSTPCRYCRNGKICPGIGGDGEGHRAIPYRPPETIRPGIYKNRLTPTTYIINKKTPAAIWSASVAREGCDTVPDRNAKHQNTASLQAKEGGGKT